MTKYLIMSGLICALFLNSVCGQQTFRKPGRKSRNQLTQEGTYLKTMFTFEVDRFDTVPLPGREPELVPLYRNEDVVRKIIQPVLEGNATVYKSNYWGGIPQFLKKTS